MPNKPIGKANIVINGKRLPFQVDVYGYKNYRSVFITQRIQSHLQKSVSELPSTAKIVDYLGRYSYTAQKFGNPNNTIPTYDFQIGKK